MNVFFVDEDPKVAAQCLVDQHVNKMLSETAQILSNCYSLERLAEDDCPRTQKDTPRKHSYPHHPCCKWVQESFDNWWWVVKHGFSLEQERLYRGFNPGFAFRFIEWCSKNVPKFSKVDMTKPAQAFGVEWEYLRGDDPVEAYRRYYNVAKRQQPTLKKVWTRRGAPNWWYNNEKMA